MVSTRKGSVQSLSYIVRSETHGDLTIGTPVRVAGERGRWSFRHHCVNTDTGSEWLDVFGGNPGEETLRAFRIDQVTATGKRQELTLEDLI